MKLTTTFTTESKKVIDVLKNPGMYYVPNSIIYGFSSQRQIIEDLIRYCLENGILLKRKEQ